MDWSSASATDKADNQLAMARANLLLGEADLAAQQSAASYAITREIAPLAAAEALVLQGQIAAMAGRVDDASATYKEAILLLSGVGADRRTAELWFELGGLLQDIGQTEMALDAYRRAAASTGLTPHAPLQTAMARAAQSREHSVPAARS
jgi:tetratricopeptide (TPR) repeat protein